MGTEAPSRPRVAVLGCGAIGGVLATHLGRADIELTIVTTNEAVRKVWRTTGPELNGRATDLILPDSQVLSRLDEQEGQFDLVFVAVQPTEVEKVVTEALPFLHERSRVVCLPNGLCEERIANIVGAGRVIGAVVAWGARMREPGHYARTSSGGFRVGKLFPGPDPELGRAVGLLSLVGPVETTENLRGARFSKLALNCAVSTIGTIGGRTLGELLARREARRIALAILREAILIADAEGLTLEPVTHLDLNWLRTSGEPKTARNLFEHGLLLAVGVRYRKLRSSMLAAVERGRAPAVDFLNGELVTRGQKHGIQTPMNAAAQRVVWEIASGKRSAGFDSLHRVLKLSETHDPSS